MMIPFVGWFSCLEQDFNTVCLQGGCVSNGALEEVVIEKNSEMDYPKSLADSIRKTKSYNQVQYVVRAILGN